MNVENGGTVSCTSDEILCITVPMVSYHSSPPYDEFNIVNWYRHTPGWHETDKEFTYGGITYGVSEIFFYPNPGRYAEWSKFSIYFDIDNYDPPSEAHTAEWRLYVDDIELSFEEADYRPRDEWYTWKGARFRPFAKNGKEVTIRIVGIEDPPTVYTPATPNSRPAGELIINGEPRIGSTLTVDTSNISDPDGMTSSTLIYYWWRNDRGTRGGNPGSHDYTLTFRDVWKPFQARLSFTDDAGKRERVRSTWTEVVKPDSSVTRDLRATVNTDGSVTLIWKAPGWGGVTGYRVLRHLPGEGEASNLVYVPDTRNTEKTYTGTNVTLGIEHVYRVAAIYSEGIGIHSNAVSVVPEGSSESKGESQEEQTQSPPEKKDKKEEQTQPPPAPTNLVGSVNENGHIVLAWDAPDDDSVTGYLVLRRRPKEGEDTLLVHVSNTNTTSTTYTDTNVTQGTLYAYRVKAINASGPGARSNYVNVTP